MKKNKHESPTVARQRSRQQLYEEGKALRNSCPRAGHADWKPPADRVDPIEILEASNKGRLPELIPVRYGRMIPSPSAFLPWRGRDYGSRPSWFVPDYPIICKNATAKNLALANLRMSEIPAEHTDKLPIDRVPFALAVAQNSSRFLSPHAPAGEWDCTETPEPVKSCEWSEDLFYRSPRNDAGAAREARPLLSRPS